MHTLATDEIGKSYRGRRVVNGVSLRVAQGEVDYLMLVRTRPGTQYAVSRELRRRIKECFEKHNVQAGNPARVYVLDKVSAPAK